MCMTYSSAVCDKKTKSDACHVIRAEYSVAVATNLWEIVFDVSSLHCTTVDNLGRQFVFVAFSLRTHVVRAAFLGCLEVLVIVATGMEYHVSQCWAQHQI